MIRPELIEQPCLVYGIGISDNSDFEALLARRCEVHAFDCTVPVDAPAVLNKSFTFHRVCIGDNPHISATSYGRKHNSSLSFESLSHVMGRLGHKRLDVLKFDIEGAEWELFRTTLLAAPDIPLPSQLLFELHTVGANPKYVPPDMVAGKDKHAVNWLFATLWHLGYRVYSKEINRLRNGASSEFSMLLRSSTLARRLLREDDGDDARRQPFPGVHGGHDRGRRFRGLIQPP